MNKYLNYATILIASCGACERVVASADVAQGYAVAGGTSSHIHHRNFDARLYPLQDKTTINQADRMVLHIDAEDVSALQLMKKPFYDVDLAGEEISLATLQGLTSYASQISALNLMETSLRDDLFPVVGEFVALESLILSDNPLSDKSMAFVGKLSELRDLAIVHTKVTDVGLQNLLLLRKLEKFDAGCNLLKNDGIKIISQMVSLIEVDVRGCEFDEQALPLFLQMPKLKKLNISNNKLKKDASLEAFLAAAKAKGIEVKIEEE